MTRLVIKSWAQSIEVEASGPVRLSGHNENIVVLSDRSDLNSAKLKIEQKGLSLVRLADHARDSGASVREVMNDVWCNGRYLVLLPCYDMYDSLLVCDSREE